MPLQGTYCIWLHQGTGNQKKSCFTNTAFHVKLIPKKDNKKEATVREQIVVRSTVPRRSCMFEPQQYFPAVAAGNSTSGNGSDSLCGHTGKAG